MLIANPIYDVSFKRLLENDSTAKFVIGTILGCKVLSLEPSPPNFLDKRDANGKVTHFIMDFAATIVTKEEGEKRVIIEMQKAKSLSDIYRFRRYLGREYRRGRLPIISIYILGFNLSIESEAFVAVPGCFDLKTGETLKKRDDFVDHLTHRAYFIQTKRIKPSLNTKLDKLLSVFEQANFVGDGTKTKAYTMETDDPDVNEVLKVLQYMAADKDARAALDLEEEYQLHMEGLFGKKDKELEQHKETIEQQKEALSQQAEALSQQAEALSQKDEENRKLAEEIEKLKKLLNANG